MSIDPGMNLGNSNILFKYNTSFLWDDSVVKLRERKINGIFRLPAKCNVLNIAFILFTS